MIRTKPPMETFQTPFELDLLLAIAYHAQPKRILEIGSWQGGTLWHWLQIADRVVSVDDQMRRADLWPGWAADAGAELVLLRGYSQQPNIIEQAAEHGPYDFVLIDGDHTYDAVRADWDGYRPLVAPGGIVAFHDIFPRPDYGVDRVWAEVKGELGARTVEITETSSPDDPRWGGLGLVWL